MGGWAWEVGWDMTHVAFLRAVNVAGHATVTMNDLARAFARAGCRDVRTYIQSGNVIYDVTSRAQPAVAAKLRTRLSRLLGTEAIVVFRTLRHLEALVGDDPFGSAAGRSDTKLYVALPGRASRRPTLPIEDRKERLRAVALRNGDVLVVSGRKPNGFYGFPNEFVEKAFGVRATSRSWNTITRIVSAFGRAAA